MYINHSHKGIYTIHTSSIIDGCRVIKKTVEEFKLFFSLLFSDKRDTIYYYRCFLSLCFVCNKHTSFIIRMSILKVRIFNQHSCILYMKKLILVFNFVHSTANNIFYYLVRFFFDVIFRVNNTCCYQMDSILLDHPFD